MNYIYVNYILVSTFWYILFSHFWYFFLVKHLNNIYMHIFRLYTSGISQITNHIHLIVHT